MSDEVKPEQTMLEWEKVNDWEWRATLNAQRNAWAVIQAHDSDNGRRIRRDGLWNIYRGYVDYPINDPWSLFDTADDAKRAVQEISDVLSGKGFTYEAGISEGKRLAIENRSVVAGELTPKDEK